MFMDNILLSISRKAVLPNMEFLINLGDWPLVKKNLQPVIPIFSWCGSYQHADIVLPTYDITEASLECMGRFENFSFSYMLILLIKLNLVFLGLP